MVYTVCLILEYFQKYKYYIIDSGTSFAPQATALKIAFITKFNDLKIYVLFHCNKF